MFEEKEIRFRNLILKILLKWKVILLVSLIFAAAVPAFKYVRDKQKNEKNSKLMYDKREYAMSLSDLYRQLDAVDSSLKRYDAIGDTMEQVHFIQLQYFVNVKTDDIDKLSASDQVLAKIAQSVNAAQDDITRMYAGYVTSAEFINNVLEGSTVEEQQFRAFMKTNVYGHNLILRFALIGDMEESVVRDRAKDLIEAQSDRFQFAGAHEIKLVAQHMTTEAAVEIYDGMYNATHQVYSIGLWVGNIEKNASENDIAYARAVADGKGEFGKPITVAGSGKKLGFSKKFAVVGFVLGLFLMCFYYACYFALSGRLQDTDELSKAAGLHLFETVEAASKKKRHGIDKKLTYLLHNNKRKLSLEQQVKAVVSAVSLFCEQNGLKTITLTSSMYGELDEETMSFLVNGLRLEGLKAEYVDDIAYDKNALRACADADGTVLIEQIGSSVLTEIEKEILSAREYKVNMIGSVIFE